MTNKSLIAVLAALLSAVPAFAQLQMGPRMSPGGVEVLGPAVPPPATAAASVLAPPETRGEAVPAADVLAGTPAKSGQQHWVSLGITTLQPFTARVGVKVWDRPNGSLWLEAYGGSELFDVMYGGGARMQFTAKEFGHGDPIMIAPGFGAHVLPNQRIVTRREYHSGYYSFGYYDYTYAKSTAVFLAADVDISWLHDFSPHFGVEIGFKLGLAFRASGQVGDWTRGIPNTMFNSNLFPIVSFFYGLRF